MPNNRSYSGRCSQWVYAAILIALVSTSPTLAADDNTQTGKIVWSVTTDAKINAFEQFAFFFKSRDGKHRDYASYSHDSFLSKGSDFIGDSEKGGVEILTVPAGDWEMISYNMSGLSGLGSATFFPKEDYSIPITVKPGRAVYIGSYRAAWANGQNIFGMGIRVGGYFVVSDGSERDITIAKKKGPLITDVDVQIPDFASLKIPFFVLPAAPPMLSSHPN